jgi:hypothetical protein
MLDWSLWYAHSQDQPISDCRPSQLGWTDGRMGRWVAEGTNDACWPDNEVQLLCQGCVTSSIYLRSMPLDYRLSNMAWLKHADRNCHQMSA